MDFTEQTERFILESGMLRQKESVTVGISGGADSVCLFLQLYKLKEKLGIELKAVTVEHGIRGDESEKDAEFSKKFCEERGIPSRIVHVDAPKRAAEKGISLEEAARQLEIDIQCLKNYEVECQKGTVSTETFATTMNGASVEAQRYASNIKNGTGSVQTFVANQKAIQSSMVPN